MSSFQCPFNRHYYLFLFLRILFFYLYVFLSFFFFLLSLSLSLAPATLVDIFQLYGVQPPPRTMQPVVRAVSGTSFPASAGDTFNLTCLAWEKLSEMGFKDINIQALTNPALPTAIKRSTITVFGTQGFRVRVVSIPVKMTGDRHKQPVYCTATFISAGSGSATQKQSRLGKKFILYAFSESLCLTSCFIFGLSVCLSVCLSQQGLSVCIQ